MYDYVTLTTLTLDCELHWFEDAGEDSVPTFCLHNTAPSYLAESLEHLAADVDERHRLRYMTPLVEPTARACVNARRST